MNIIDEEKIIIDQSYFKRKDNQKNNAESCIKPSTLEDILDSIYQQEYLDGLHFQTESHNKKENNNSSNSTSFKAKKKYFN